MAYSVTTFGALCSALATRLGDTGSTYWRNSAYGDELSVYLWEALRTWQAYSAFSRTRCGFNMTSNTTWYDLTTVASTGSGPQNPSMFVGPVVNDSDIVQSIQYHLIENHGEMVDGTAWVGTEMFTLASVTAAMQRALNQFLQDTGCQIANFQQPGPTPTSDLVNLPQTVIDVRRAAWIDGVTGAYTPLWRGSLFGAQAFNAGFNRKPANPVAFDITGESPLQMRLLTPPVASGSIDFLAVQTGPTLNPETGVVLGILDNLSPAIKWGTMADLLGQEGEAQDLKRAAYCQQRYGEFVELARTLPLCIQAQINGVACQMGAVQDADSFQSNWQTPPSGTQQPLALLSAGLNLVAPCPQPDNTGPYSVQLDLVTNANIPVTNAAYVQVGQENLDTILDYAQHLCAFKQGGSEFLATIPLYQNFVREAGIFNDRLRGTSTYLDVIQGLSQRETSVAPRRESDVEVAP